MKFIAPVSLFAILTVTLISCRNQEGKEVASVNQKQDIALADGAAKNETAGPEYFAADTVAQSSQQIPSIAKAAPDWDKKIIKNASLQVEVKDYRNFNGLLHRDLKRFGAYISNEEQVSSIYRLENVITIKVPVDQFDDAVQFLTPDSLKVHEKRISSEDVTSQVIDTKSRMQAKKEVRDRYLELLRQAKTTKDILAVQNEVNSIQEEIEAAEGRLNYMSHSSSFSTITIRYFQQLNEQDPGTDEPGYVNKILESFKVGAKWVGDLFIALIALWPLWIGVGFLLFYFRRWRSAARANTVKVKA